MKHISNTSPYPNPYNFTVGNILNVPTINTTIINTSSINVSTLNGGNILATTLSLPPTITSFKISMYGVAPNQFQFDGFGTGTNTLKYQVAGIGNNHIFYAGTSSTTEQELFRVKGTGGFISNGDSSVTGNLNITGTLTAPNIPIYQAGTFTPTVQCLRATDGVLYKEGWANPIFQEGNGGYIRVGNLVTVWFYARTDFNGTANGPGEPDGGHRFVVITDLPYTCNHPDTNLQSGGVITYADFPDGYVGSIAGPATTTMNGGYICEIIDQGTLFYPVVQPAPDTSQSWTSDGTTLVISCQQSAWLTVQLWEKEGTAYNANVGFGNYTAAFKGSITYMTS